MKLKLKRYYYPLIFLIAAHAGIYSWMAYALHAQRLTGPTGDMLSHVENIKFTGGFMLVMTLFATGFWILRTRIEHIFSTQDWLIGAVSRNIEMLKVHGLDKILDGDKKNDVSEKPTQWPWGAHHTEHLGHLEAAARRFWTLYDPSDPSTAPTNNMVSDWLHDERGVSKDKARAIASILRADGLATGPR